MTTSRCDHCDLIIGAGCACSPQPPQGKTAARPEWGYRTPFASLGEQETINVRETLAAAMDRVCRFTAT